VDSKAEYTVRLRKSKVNNRFNKKPSCR